MPIKKMERMSVKKIAVIAGGDSSEIVISHRSAAQVYTCLDRTVYEPYMVTIVGKRWTVELQGVEYAVDKNDFSFTDNNGHKRVFDFALIMIHGTPGENGILQGYFELMGIPYSSCGVAASAVTFDKTLCKKAVEDVDGIFLARQVTIHNDQHVDSQWIADTLGLPMFIKPNASGSSFGVTKVKSVDQIAEAIELARTESIAVMAEEFIEGVEVSQGVMIVSGKEYVLPITELVSKNEFFDFQAKYTAGMTQEITPARIPMPVAQQIGDTSLAVYKALGLSGIVRIDYIIKGTTPYFIEVNTTPGMSAASIVPQQWQAVGLSMGDAFNLIIKDKFL